MMPKRSLIAQSSRLLSRFAQKRPPTPFFTLQNNFKSTSAVSDHYHDNNDKTTETVEFTTHGVPVLLDAKEHVVGYLSRILNARVYDAAIETDLQHAKNLSAVR
jgi:hypothetical protein